MKINSFIHYFISNNLSAIVIVRVDIILIYLEIFIFLVNIFFDVFVFLDVKSITGVIDGTRRKI